MHPCAAQQSAEQPRSIYNELILFNLRAHNRIMACLNTLPDELRGKAYRTNTRRRCLNPAS